MLAIQELSKSFGSRKILDRVSFQVSQAEIVFILGQSGTGKSVLLKCIVGLLKADSGKILVDGQNVVGLTEPEMLPVRRKCGMVFQQPALFDSLTIRENIFFGLKRHFQLSEKENQLRIEKALEAVQLSQQILPQRPFEISYGMQKRVSLARTLVLEPEILLFDEPTTGLDPVATTAINQLIARISREYKTTSMVVSHDMRCADEIADRALFLQAGKVIYDDKLENISQSKESIVQDFFAEIRRT